MEREDAKVGNLEMRAKVRGEVWVRRLTAGRDIVKEELGNKIEVEGSTIDTIGEREGGKMVIYLKTNGRKEKCWGRKGENGRGRVPS